MRGLLLLISLGVTFLIKAQVTDDFSDGDFTATPTWSGTSSFGVDDPYEIVEADNQLRSQNLDMGSGTRVTYLSTSDALDLSSSTAEWALRFRLDFNQPGSESTNSNNTSRVYLMSNSADLSGDLNGYYIELRYPDSDINEVRLHRQDGSSSTELTLSGTIQPLTSKAFVDVLVTRSEVGLWELEVNSVSQGAVTDNTYSTSSHFGVQVRYTANTRDNGFYFDDFATTVTPVADTDPPIIQSVTAISDTQIDIQFNENVDETTAQTTNNYSLDGGLNVSNALRDGSDNSIVHLTIDAMTNGITYALTVNNVEDESGNVIVINSQETYEYLVIEEATEFDLVINEFMAAPGTSSGVPNAEFVELYNRSTKFITLENWTLSDVSGPSSVFLSDTLRPGDYLILTATGNGSLFDSYGDVLEVSGFPTLNNSGDSIIIANASATVIHEIAYTNSSSGVSTELINPNGPDYSANNYGTSTDPDGGTPGAQNSIFDDTPDTTAPSISSISVISATELEVTFDETLEETSAETAANYTVDGGITVNTAARDESDNALVHLTVGTLPSGEIRTLTVNGVEDLSGNPTSNATIDFEYIETEIAVVNDVVINEFLAAPSSSSTIPNAEYIEVFNRSDKFIDLNGWTLSDAAGSSAAFGTFILRPDSFLILTETDNGSLFTSYGDVLEVNNFPSLNNGGDSIILSNASATIIHETAYTSSSSGISTELINPNGPDYSANNYGTSTDPDGGTPGEQNSIFDDTPDTTPPSINSINVVSATELDVTFNEPLDETTAEATGNYSIEGGITITTASLDETNNELVHLTVGALPSGETRTLTVNGVEDLSGNATNNTTIEFEYIETETAAVNDVVINEFMPDPTPSKGLPEAEFIELYNRSDKNLNLLGWTLDGSTLGHYVLKPNQYVFAVDDSSIGLFEEFENVIEVQSLSLSNGEDEIILQDSAGIVIHTISYRESSGGISIELINPNGPCLSDNSYSFSIDPTGGTPGEINSIFDDSPDTINPTIQSYNFSTNLIVNFSEVMNAESLKAGTYNASEDLTISQIKAEGDFPTSVEIFFNEEIETGIVYNMTIAGVKDCSGNQIEEATIQFGVGRNPEFNELIITEIMFDPDPQIGLPNREFIEIYNSTSEILTTQGLELVDESGIISLPTFMLNPDEYHVLTTNSGVSEFANNAVGVSNFPTLSNTGEQVILKSGSELIFSFTYDPDWHDDDKADGGYSLEMLDLENQCGEENNWSSSLDINGGTPGAVNSRTASVPDNFAPSILTAVALDEDSVHLRFDEKLNPSSQVTTAIQIDPNIEVEKIYFLPFFPKSLFIKLSSNLVENRSYNLDLSGVSDCSGNVIQDGTIEIALPVSARADEIQLSEILFNPRSNGVDFVELYNSSNKYISLKGWRIGSMDRGEFIDEEVISEKELVIEPDSYLVLTTDSETLLSNYPKGDKSRFIELSALPSYPNEEGVVAIMDDEDTIGEVFEYHEDYHYNLLESVDGVSLERVSFSESVSNSDNWRSASSIEGFATPGYANSQTFSSEAPSGKVSASPEVFIPGNNGSGRDYTTINYSFDQAGKFANVRIYDRTGRLVKDLAEGVLLSTQGFLRWDGDTNSGEIARMGYYLIIFEIYDSSGNSEVIKETVVVGRDF
ncbi:Lamin Tail Domain [Ekhidna lutea]|uniref:Lamin Tail Domain n=1 Tax=Ekhidna lutea TaxID=447679 RepID=A0A239FCT1_EKHLU|nr:lamin tail domain-containing protein [Ekhidna lutea]SNS54726.1 Lamin Tail Domain [Ekhidna lutea]